MIKEKIKLRVTYTYPRRHAYQIRITFLHDSSVRGAIAWNIFAQSPFTFCKYGTDYTNNCDQIERRTY